MKGLDEEIRTRIHKLVKTQVTLLEARLLKQIDLILDQELGNPGASRRFDEQILAKQKYDEKEKELMTSLAKEFESVRPEDLLSQEEEKLNNVSVDKANVKKNELEQFDETENYVESKNLFQSATAESGRGVLGLIDEDKGYDSDNTADLLSRLSCPV